MSTRGSKTLHAVSGHVGERIHEDRDSSLSGMAGKEIILNAGSKFILLVLFPTAYLHNCCCGNDGQALVWK